ncbi:MAG: hypothetical protein L3J83_10640 [Proteobacteria bacterium]|nr:hypothetical protein [Pseudomonadota bacterium]
MKNLKKLMFLVCLPILVGVSCEEQDNNLSGACIEGIIPNDTLYKVIYKECYQNSFWIEVLNNDTLGKDVKIYTPAPTLTPNPPIEYSNIIEVPILGQLLRNNRRDTLLGKKIYFHYREAEESEISAIRNNECEEVYETHKVPVVILTGFSFSACNKLLEN